MYDTVEVGRCIHTLSLYSPSCVHTAYLTEREGVSTLLQVYDACSDDDEHTWAELVQVPDHACRPSPCLHVPATHVQCVFLQG